MIEKSEKICQKCFTSDVITTYKPDVTRKIVVVGQRCLNCGYCFNKKEYPITKYYKLLGAKEVLVEKKSSGRRRKSVITQKSK